MGGLVNVGVAHPHLLPGVHPPADVVVDRRGAVAEAKFPVRCSSREGERGNCVCVGPGVVDEGTAVRHPGPDRMQQRPDCVRMPGPRSHGRECQLEALVLRRLRDRDPACRVGDRHLVNRVHLVPAQGRRCGPAVRANREVVELIADGYVDDGRIQIRPRQVVTILERPGRVEAGELLDRQVGHPARPADVGERSISELVGLIGEVPDVQFPKSVPRPDPGQLVGHGCVLGQHRAPRVRDRGQRPIGDRRRCCWVVEVARVDVVRVLHVQQAAARSDRPAQHETALPAPTSE